jgi:hypothetical protein
MVDLLLRYPHYVLFAFGLFGTIAAIVITARLVPRKEFEARFKEEQDARVHLETKILAAVDGLDRRLLHVESELQHLPTSEDMQKLMERLVAVDANGQSTARAVDSIGRSVARIEDYLLKKGE